MECSVFDTYVNTTQGGLMHFDIIVPVGTADEVVFKFGKEYLGKKGQSDAHLSTEECKFCHIEKAELHVEEAIHTKGYYILEMEGCEV